MKILYIYNVSFFFCLHRLVLAKKLIKDGNDVHLICKVTNDNDRRTILEAGIKLYDLNLKRGFWGILMDFLQLIKIRKTLSEINPNVTEIATIKPVIITGLLFKFNNKKVVYWLSGLGYVFTSEKKTIKILKYLVIKLYKFIFNNKNAKVILENIEDQMFLINKNVISKSQSFVLTGSCVEIEKYSYVKEPTKIKVVLASRMLWDKGIGDYIEAIKILQSRKIECDFLLAGMTDENPSSIPIERIKFWEQSGYIKYLGFVKDIISLYQNSNIICLPSFREGMPKTLVEAGACSRASVTTDVPGCRNIITNNFNGHVVPAKNPLELANALAQLINNPNERFLMANNARKHIELNFTHHIFYKKINNIYFD